MTIYEKLSAIQQKMKVPKNLRNTFGGTTTGTARPYWKSSKI